MVNCDTLVEFDGDFWHPKTLEECKYPFQESNFKKTIIKNEYAKNNGYELFRIRQSSKEIILDLINDGILK